MDNNTVLNNLQDIFKDILGDDVEISLETTPNDIEEWDSFAHISILEVVQTDYNIVFTLDEIVEMKNVKDIVNAIVEKK